MSDNTKKSKFYLTNEDVYKYFREESAKEAHSSDEGWMGLNLSHDVALNRMPHSLCHEAKDGIIPNDCIAVNVERNFFYNKVLRFHDFDARVKFQQIRNNAIRDAETADFLENYCNNIPTSKNELRYYLSRDTIQSLSGPYNPRPEFFLEPHLISVAKDGKIPEGAAEVVFKDSLKIGPYIEDPSLLNEALDNFEDPCFIPSLFFEFADKENRNKCQSMIDDAFGPDIENKSAAYISIKDLQEFLRENCWNDSPYSLNAYVLDRLPASMFHEAKDGIIPNDCIALDTSIQSSGHVDYSLSSDCDKFWEILNYFEEERTQKQATNPIQKLFRKVTGLFNFKHEKAPEPQPEVKSQTPEEQANKTPGNSKEPEKTPDQQSEMKSQTMDTSDPRVQQGQREQKQSSIIADNGKINIDPMVFDEKSYRQALDILQKPDAKFYITAKDVVRGWTNPDQRKFTYANAADLISRWPTCVNVAIPDTPLNKIEQLFNPDLPASASAKIPDGAIEVKPGLSVIQGLKWSLDSKKCLFHMDDCMWKDFSCADPKRLNDLEGLVKCVDHGLENYPNLALEVAENKIPAFAYDQFNDIVDEYRLNNVDFTAPEKQLDSLKLDHTQKYFFENTGIQEFTDNWIATGSGDDKAPGANDVLRDFLVLRSTDGKVPEGAAEVCFKNGLKPEYRAEDVALAVDLNQIISHKNIGLPGNQYRSGAMTFASEKDWNKCQAMVESALEKTLSKIKEQEPEQKSQSHSQSHTQSR